MSYTLLGADGRPRESDVKGQWGGHRRTKIYGRLDCLSALRAIASGGYVRHRVFFAGEATAIAAGYRPCAVCCPDRYQAWKATLPASGPGDAAGLVSPQSPEGATPPSSPSSSHAPGSPSSPRSATSRRGRARRSRTSSSRTSPR